MRYNIKSPHFHDGGTGIVTFRPAFFPLYEEAVRRHGDPRFVISAHPIATLGAQAGYGSLHDLRAGISRIDASAFWNTFHKVEAEFEAAEKKRKAEEAAKAAEEARRKPQEVTIGGWKVRLTVDNTDHLRVEGKRLDGQPAEVTLIADQPKAKADAAQSWPHRFRRDFC